MKKTLDNWIVKDPTPEEWHNIAEGVIQVSTVVISNTNESGAIQAKLRIADHYGNTLMLLEPSVTVEALQADSFARDSLPIKEKQILQVMVNAPGVHILVAGARIGQPPTSIRDT